MRVTHKHAGCNPSTCMCVCMCVSTFTQQLFYSEVLSVYFSISSLWYSIAILYCMSDGNNVLISPYVSDGCY